MEIVILKIVDNDTSYEDRTLDTFVVVNPTQEAIDGFKKMLEDRYSADDWEYRYIYDYVYEYFTVLEHSEIEIPY